MLTMLVNAYSFVLKLGMIRLLLTIWAMATLAYSENENWKPILVPEKKEGLINS